MAENFGDVFGAEELVAPAKAEEKADKAAKKALYQEMVSEFQGSLKDEGFRESLHTLSDSIKVVNSLGYGKDGGLIQDPSTKVPGAKRAVIATSKIVGYVIENCGKEAFSYEVEEFSKNEEGLYVGTVVTKTLAPGQKVAMSRKDLAKFTSKPEISFTLSNGKIVSPKKSCTDINKHLEGHYFRFNDGSIKVNDDSVKVAIDDAAGNIKPEYEATFGYLLNPAKKSTRVKGQKKQEFSAQDLAANYVQLLLKKNPINA